jgi:hypothetical protein
MFRDQKAYIQSIVCQKRLLSLRRWPQRAASVVASLALVAGALPLSAQAAGEALEQGTIPRPGFAEANNRFDHDEAKPQRTPARDSDVQISYACLPRLNSTAWLASATLSQHADGP